MRQESKYPLFIVLVQNYVCELCVAYGSDVIINLLRALLNMYTVSVMQRQMVPWLSKIS